MMRCKYCNEQMRESLVGQFQDSRYYCSFCGYSETYCVGSGFPSDVVAPTGAYRELQKMKLKAIVNDSDAKDKPVRP